MKNFFAQFGRALYQILVVSIILLPYRLIAAIVVLGQALMSPASGIAVKDALATVWHQIRWSWALRIEWVKKGTKKMFEELNG